MSQFVGISEACLIARSDADTGDGNLVLVTSADPNVVSIHLSESLIFYIVNY